MTYSQCLRDARVLFGPLARFWWVGEFRVFGLEKGDNRYEISRAKSYEVAFRMACARMMGELRAMEAAEEPEGSPEQ